MVFRYDGHRDILERGAHAADSFPGCEVYDPGEEVSVYVKGFYGSGGKVYGVVDLEEALKNWRVRVKRLKLERGLEKIGKLTEEKSIEWMKGVSQRSCSGWYNKVSAITSQLTFVTVEHHAGGQNRKSMRKNTWRLHKVPHAN